VCPLAETGRCSKSFRPTRPTVNHKVEDIADAMGIRGDKAHHQKAIGNQVHEAVEEVNRSEAADKKLQEDIKKAERDRQPEE
jgi:hypothetical protein